MARTVQYEMCFPVSPGFFEGLSRRSKEFLAARPGKGARAAPAASQEKTKGNFQAIDMRTGRGLGWRPERANCYYEVLTREK